MPTLALTGVGATSEASHQGRCEFRSHGASINVNTTGVNKFLKLARFNLLRSYRNRMATAPGFLDSISPWTSRSTTPKPGQGKGDDSCSPQTPVKQQSIDHTISHRHRLSLRDYPEDCPKSNVRWFYAVDVRRFWHLNPTQGSNCLIVY